MAAWDGIPDTVKQGRVGMMLGPPAPQQPVSYNFGSYNAQPQYYNPFAGVDFAALMEAMKPKTAPQMMSEALQANAMLPGDMQFGSAGIDGNSVAEARSRYQADVVRPSVEKLKAEMDAEGRGNSTFGGAALAQAQAEGDRQAFYASQDMIDRAINRWATKRQSLFQGEARMASPDQGGREIASFLLGAGRLGLDSQRLGMDSMDNWMAMDKYRRQNSFFGKYGDSLIGLGTTLAGTPLFGQAGGAAYNAVRHPIQTVQRASNWLQNKFAHPKQTNTIWQQSPGSRAAADPTRPFGAADWSFSADDWNY